MSWYQSENLLKCLDLRNKISLDSREAIEKFYDVESIAWKGKSLIELKKDLVCTNDFIPSRRTLNLYSGAIGNPFLLYYGMLIANNAESRKINPLGASVAVLAPEWEDKLKSIYRIYIKSLSDIKQLYPEKINKIIIPANFFKLSFGNVMTALDNPEEYLKYSDPRKSLENEVFNAGSAIEVKHDRNYEGIYNILNLIKQDVSVINNEEVRELELIGQGLMLLDRIVKSNVKIIDDLIKGITCDSKYDNINRSDFLITTDIGPELDPYPEDPSSRWDGYYVRYHKPVILSSVDSGVDYVHFGTLAKPGEVYGIGKVCKELGVPFAVSSIPGNNINAMNQSSHTPILLVISELLKWYDSTFLYAGLNCKGPSLIADSLNNIRELIDLLSKKGFKRKHNSSYDLMMEDIEKYYPISYKSLSEVCPNSSHLSTNLLDNQILPVDIGKERYITYFNRLLEDHPYIKTIGGCCGIDPTSYFDIFSEIVKNF